MMEKVRSDALPENTDYRDTGCSFHPACLTCPLQHCVHDVTHRKAMREERDVAILEEFYRGASVEEIAGRHGISKRTVFRVLTERRGAA